MRPDINYKKRSVRNTNTWRLNNMFLHNQQVTEEIKRTIKKFLETNDNGNMTPQNLWDAAKAALRGGYSSIILLQETRKTSTSLNLHLKQLEKKNKKPPKLAKGKKS